MWPVFAWVKTSCAADETVGDDDDEDDAEDIGVDITVSGGRLTASTKAPQDYIHRCVPDDVSHPLHGLSYFMHNRLARSDETARKPPKRKRSDNDDGPHAIDGDGLPSGAASRSRGPQRSHRYPFHGGYKPGATQELRVKPCLLNIGREPPLEEANPEMFVYF